MNIGIMMGMNIGIMMGMDIGIMMGTVMEMRMRMGIRGWG